MNLSHKFYKEVSRFALTLSISGAIILGTNAHSMDAPFQCPSEAEVMDYINSLKKYSNSRNFKIGMGFILFSKDARKNWELLNSNSLFDEPSEFMNLNEYSNTYKYPTGFTRVKLSQMDNEGKICEYQALRLGMASNISEIPFTFREYSEFGNFPILPGTETESIDVEVEEPGIALPPRSGFGAIESDSMESDKMPGIGVPLYETFPNPPEQDIVIQQPGAEEEGTFEPQLDVEEQDIFIPQPGGMQETIVEDTFGPQSGDDMFGLNPKNEPAQSRNMPGEDDNLSFEPPNVTSADDVEEFGDFKEITKGNEPEEEDEWTFVPGNSDQDKKPSGFWGWFGK